VTTVQGTQVPPPAQRRELDRALVTGLAWTGGVKWGAQLLRWLASLVIARLLHPGDYGLVGMALVFMELVQIVNQFGLHAAIVQNRTLDEDHLARLGGLGVLIAVSLFLVSCAFAVPVALFYDEPAVRNIVIVLSVKLIIDSFGMLPRALLARELKFGILAWTEGLSAVAMAGVTLACAYLDNGYWSLVIGVLAGSVLTTVLSIIVRPHRLSLPRRWHELRASVRFGRDVLVSSIAWYAFSNADFVIVGRLFDKTAFGLYTFAWNVASVPVEKVSALVGSVTPGVFSAVQRDLAGFRRYFVSITEALALITMPLAIGLSLVADDFVRVVVGERWMGAVFPLRVLALLGGFRSLTTLLSQVMVATGNPHLSRRCSLITASVLPLCFLIGSRWGLTGVAAGWLVGFPITVVAFDYRYALRLIGLPGIDYLRVLWPALSSTGAMALAVSGVAWLLPTSMSAPARLGVQVLAGAVTYLATVTLAHGARVRSFWTVLRLTRGTSTS
jgi:teichuronic acid exporter